MGMQRYSSDINALSGEEGDDTLLGVDEWSAPENIKPGLCQSAVNCDFTSGDGVTRGGFVCLPALGANLFAGQSWTARTSASASNWAAIAYGNGQFAAVAASAIMTSPDGVTWTSRSGGLSDPGAICFGNGAFVATRASGALSFIWSTDGITWASTGIGVNASFNGIAFGNGLFVAVGHDGSSGKVLTSSISLLVWTSRTPASNDVWQAVTFGGGLFVAVASSGAGSRIMTSVDGVTWTARTAPATRAWRSIAYGNGLFVAVASDGAGVGDMMTSTDGITWSSVSSSQSTTWKGIAFGNNTFVAVSNAAGNTVSTASRDGTNWYDETTATDELNAIAYGADAFVAVGQDATTRVMSLTAPVTFASGIYSDPDDPGSQWIMTVHPTSVRFNTFGRSARTVSIVSGQTVSEQSTIVQCNNLVYIFRGPDATPLRWDGNWANTFELATGTIQPSSQALYYQNRLWEIVGKDGYYASDVLDFTAFTEITNQFNLSTGDSNFLVTSYPFGNSTILLFKNRSIMALSGVDGALGDVVASEITRQVGAIGINAVVSVGPDVVYMSDRNINLITLTSTNNSLQHKTLPLSRNIQKIFNRVNWEYGYKVSMGFYDNKLFVALPLDNATGCNAVVVYNFVTDNWFGEWNFAREIGMNIQGFVVANYLGLQRLHAISEDGRIFVVGDGQNDISGATVAEITASLTTRAYSFGNQNHTPRRMYLDLATNRPNFSVTAYAEGVSESTEELSDQTFSRSDSWIFNDSSYDLTNANDDYNRAGRRDYSAGTGSGGIQSGSGFMPEAEQEYRLPIMTRRNGRLSWLAIENTTGTIRIMTVGFEARSGNRGNFIQVL